MTLNPDERLIAKAGIEYSHNGYVATDTQARLEERGFIIDELTDQFERLGVVLECDFDEEID